MHHPSCWWHSAKRTSWIWGFPIPFSWRVNEHFCFAWSVNEDFFFPWLVNLYFSVLGNLVFDFFVIREICIYFHVICEPTTFAGIIFLPFLELLASLKLVNYTKLVDVKRAHWMPLRMQNWSRTNHSDSELRGPRICNHGQESWEKFALWAQVRREYNFTCLTSPPIPNTMLKTTCNFIWFSALYLSGEKLPGKQRFTTSVLKHR